MRAPGEPLSAPSRTTAIVRQFAGPVRWGDCRRERPMGRLSTHVLDTMAGTPGAGMEIELWRACAGAWEHVTTITTNEDGRSDAPLLGPRDIRAGGYELRFRAGDYLRRRGVPHERAALSRCDSGSFLDCRPRGLLSRAAASLTFRVLHLPGKLTRSPLQCEVADAYLHDSTVLCWTHAPISRSRYASASSRAPGASPRARTH